MLLQLLVLVVAEKLSGQADEAQKSTEQEREMKLRLLVCNPREGETKITHPKGLLQLEKGAFLKLQWGIEEARWPSSCGLSKAWKIDDPQNRLQSSCFISVRMQLQWELSCCLCCELSRSKAFQKGFSSWLLAVSCGNNKRIYLNNHNKDINKKTSQTSQNLNHMDIEVLKRKGKLKTDKEKKMLITVDILMLFPAHFQSLYLEIRWSYLMLPLLLGRFYLEYIMACLSTLGGAYSSLGEQSKYHATIAGKLSIKQLAVASKLDNPILASHCRLYHAHSLMQTRNFKAASKIIKNEYKFANSSVGKFDTKLLSCCKAAWERLKYLQSRQKKLHSETKES